MVNAQEYINQTYHLQERSSTENLDLSNKNLEGEVDLSDFTNLRKVNISHNPSLKSINGVKRVLWHDDDCQKGVKIKNYIKAQEWLEKKYFDKERTEEIKRESQDDKYELSINDGFSYPRLKELEGGLIISNFPNLKKIDIDRCGTIIDKLEILNCPQLAEVNCRNNKLTSLIFDNCPSVNVIHCSNNKLTSLDLKKQSKLTTIYCSDNMLEDIDLPTAGQENLAHLYLENNNFRRKLEPYYPFYDNCPYSNYQDLSFLTPFVNLKELGLGNTDEERIKKGVYNRFMISLEPLKNMNKLEFLDNDNTDIGGGWEYLPLEKLNWFHCSFDKRFDSKVSQLFYSLCDPSLPGHPGEEFVKKNWIKLGGFKDHTTTRLLSRVEELQGQLWEEKKKVYEINKKNKVLNEELEDCRKQLNETKEENSELENELTIERDHAADIDKWYKGQLDGRSDKERNKLWNDILELKWEKRNNKQIIKKLEDNLVATNKLAERVMEELESEKIIAQIQVKET
jgi:hypothetical protein